MGEPVVEMAAIAPRCSPADPFGLQHDDLDARFRKLARRGKPGEAGADDGDVVMSFDGALGAAGKGLGRVVPVGFELHPRVSVRARRHQAGPRCQEFRHNRNRDWPARGRD